VDGGLEGSKTKRDPHGKRLGEHSMLLHWRARSANVSRGEGNAEFQKVGIETVSLSDSVLSRSECNSRLSAVSATSGT